VALIIEQVLVLGGRGSSLGSRAPGVVVVAASRAPGVVD